MKPKTDITLILQPYENRHHECYMISNVVTPQIIFDGFTVGRFDEGIADNEFETTDVSLMLSAAGAELPGCPDGFMQV